MKLIVEAPVAAGLLRSERSETIMVACLVVRERFGINERGLLALPDEMSQAAIRVDAVDRLEFGELPPDEIPPRTGTDVMVLGDAVCPAPTIATRVEVHVGEYHLALDVFGDRVWEGAGGALMPSNPTPFSSMPITYANAFGGAAEGEYGPIPWYMNPTGKGYFIKSGEAKGKALPNVELAASRIKAWDDKPPPAGLAPYPAIWGLKWERYLEVKGDQEDVEIHPERGMYDRAHPLLTGKNVVPGPMKILGMSTRPMLFDVPECAVDVVITVGPTEVTRSLELEEILVDTRQATVEFAWRKMFRYEFVPHQRRQARVIQRKTPPGRPTSAFTAGPNATAR